jgi:ABC-type multidrug transport system fused ATPase/permease subunit
LDPLKVHDDARIIDILKDFGIWEKFNSVDGIAKGDGLKYKIENDSKNLSQGEKQLLCMARALLHKNKVVLLDEATANIDVVTEAKIQNAIKEHFNDSTILMIAHRLNTIMWCDKILVLEKGELLEFDDRANLQNNPHSVFGRMVSVNEDIKAYLK